MKLKALIENLVFQHIENISDYEIKGVSCNSANVAAGYLFVAIKGEKVDGHNFVEQAIDKGARAVILQRDLALEKRVTKIIVADTRAALACASSAFFDFPAKRLRVIGITGTNGKTTTTYLIEKILSCAGHPCGVIGTVNYRIMNKQYPAPNTTPQADVLQSFLQEIVRAKAKYAIIEVSSHALSQHRVDYIDFSSAIFTNLSREHLDYHQSLSNYFSCKLKLFERLNKQAWAIVNADEAYGRKIISKINSRHLTYGISSSCDIRAKNIRLGSDKSQFTVLTPKGKLELESLLIGRHNVYNILAAVACAFVEEIDFSRIVLGVKSFSVVPGRLERINCGQGFAVFVDYAHTKDALEKILITVRQIKKDTARPHRRALGKIILVFGCGGDRDKTKRPQMGRVACTLSDFVIITTDNPRSEDPQQIAADIVRGIDKKANNYQVVLDRFAAIKQALAQAREQDIVLIAGKGHESTQIFADRTIPFNDRHVAEEMLRCSV